MSTRLLDELQASFDELTERHDQLRAENEELKAEQEWVPVQERLPGIPIEVMVAYESDNDGEPCLDVGTATLFFDKKWYSVGMFYKYGVNPPHEFRVTERAVRYWKHKPKAPKQEPQ